MRHILIALLVLLSCVSKAQDSVILKTGTDGYVTIISNGVSANYTRGRLGSIYYYGADSLMGINYMGNNGPTTMFYPKNKTYWRNGDVSNSTRFTSMYAIVQWMNAHFEFVDTSSGGGGVQTVAAGTGTTVTGTTNVTVAVTNPVYTATVTLTSPMLLSLNTTPVTVVASPGAGKVIKVHSIIWKLNYNSSPYSSVVPTLYLGGVAYKYLTTFCITNAANSFFDVTLNVSAAGSNTASNNSSTLTEGALTFSASTNPTGGNSTAELIIEYTIENY